MWRNRSSCGLLTGAHWLRLILSTRQHFLVPVVVLMLQLPKFLTAGEIWDGGGANSNWTTGANWNRISGFQFPPPNNGFANIVMPAVTGLVQTPIVNVPYNINSLTFSSDGGNGRFVILGVEELTIGAGGITNNDADIQSLFGSLKLSANQTWTAAAGPLQMDAVSLNGFNVTLAGAYPIDLPSVIVGTGDLTVANTYMSTVTMSGSASNTYTGETTVEQSTLVLQKSGGATAVPGELFIYSGATVRLDADEQISHACCNGVHVQGLSGLLDLNGHTETVFHLAVSSDGNVTTGTGVLKIGNSLYVTFNGTVTGNLSLGDVTALVQSDGEITTNNNLIIGEFVNGTLDINTGGDVRNGSAYIGYQSGSTGAVTVNGVGSTWTNFGFLGIGEIGTGELEVTAGGKVSNTNETVGQAGSAAALVSGPGSMWTNTSFLEVGNSGTGSLTIENSGVVTNADGFIGRGAGSKGTVVVRGTNSTWTNTGLLFVGQSGTGDLSIEAGGKVTVAGNTDVNSLSQIYVSSGTGVMTVTGGARVETLTGAIGSFDPNVTGSVATVTLDGTDASGNPSSWVSSAGLNMGLASTSEGTISILNGALMDTPYLGVGNPGQGIVTVNGSDLLGNPSRLDVGNLQIGTGSYGNGTGEVTASDGGRIDAGSVSLAHTGGAATLTITDPNSKLVQSGASTLTVGDATIGVATINVLNGGLIESGTGAIMFDSTATMLLTGTSAAGTFNANGPMTVRGSVEIGDLPTGAGGALNIHAGLTIDGGTVHLADGVLDADMIALSNGGTFDFDGGTLHVDDFQNNLTNEGGTLAPGNSAGHTDITGNYTQLGSATLGIEIGGVVPGQWDTLTVTGNAILDGTIQVALLNGFQPVLGNSFTILTTTFGNVGGEFDTKHFPLVAGVTFDVIYNPQSVVLQVIEATTLPGDFDNDLDVDGRDFLVWQKGGSPNPLSSGDLALWQGQYGTPFSATANTVPEPGTLVLLMGGVLVVGRRCVCAAR